MRSQEIFVGIDVAKGHLDIGVRPTREEWRVDNEEEGIQEVVDACGSWDAPWWCWKPPVGWNCH